MQISEERVLVSREWEVGHSGHKADIYADVTDLTLVPEVAGPALHKLDGYPYDYHRLLYSFRVKSRTQDAGIYRPRHAWSFGGGITFKERVSTP